MTRKKVKLVWIVNDAARKASLKKRRIGLLKKVSELTTLCGVSAFCIIYSPEEPEPMIWPSPSMVEQLLIRYQNIPEIERSKKMMNQESYLKERVAKVQDQSRKNVRKNREIEMSYLMDKLHKGNGDDLDITEFQVLIWLLEEKMKELRKRIEYFQQVPPLPPGSFIPAPPPAVEGTTMEEMGQQLTVAVGGTGAPGGGDLRNTNPTDTMMWDQWFLDIINNNNDTAAGSSGAKNDKTIHQPSGYNYNMATSSDIGYASGSTGNLFGLGVPSSNINMGDGIGSSYDIGLSALHGSVNPIGGNPYGIGLQPNQGNLGGTTMGLGMPPPTTGAGGGDLGLSGFFASGNEMGLPYDVTKPWPHNFSP